MWTRSSPCGREVDRILADTSVVIDWLRAPSTRLRGIISTHAVAICGVTVAEIFAGARTAVELWTYDAHFTRMQTALPALRLFVEPP